MHLQNNEMLMNDTSLLIGDASASINNPCLPVQDTHDKLMARTGSWTETAIRTPGFLTGLEAIQNTTSDVTMQTALELDILRPPSRCKQHSGSD